MTEHSNPPDIQSAEADEISLLDLLIVLAKHKRTILGLPLVVAVIAVGYSLSLANIYTASAKVLPPQQSQSTTSAMLAQIGGLANLLGGPAGVKGPNDLYIAMLKSRIVADNLIRRFDLMQYYDIDVSHPSDAYRVLAGVTSIASGKDGIITIDFDDKDPRLAADLANAYVDELIKLTSTIAVTEASQRRLFFERQFAQAKDNLAKAEASARRALQTSGIVKVDDQGRTMVETTARLRGQITVKDIQIAAMRAFATDRNPDLQIAQRELEAMKRELAKLEGAGTTTVSPDGAGARVNDSLRLLRDVKYHEVIFELLAKQYELAKIVEAKDSSVLHVLDKAIEPDRKSKPKRTQIVLLWTIVAGLTGILWAFVREGIANLSNDPRQAAQLQAFKRYLVVWRRPKIDARD